MELPYLSSITFVLILIVNVPVRGAYKTWLSNADFANPFNWNNGRKPCGNDIVVIHEESPSIFIQVNTTLQQLILPNDGEIIFGPGSTLAFTNEPDHSADCLSSGSAVEFNLTYPHDWLDSRNWCQTETESGTCKNAALLDSELIPCQTDDVVFPKQSSYFVNLESNLSMSINTIQITGTAFTTSTFSQFLNTTDGRRMFPIPRETGSRSSLQILRRKCTDPTGCPCGNNDVNMMKRICKHRTPYCSRIRCKSPIRSQGSCCDMCGAVLTVQYGTGFNFADLKNGLQRSFLDENDKYKDVKYIVSKLSDGYVQIVLSDVSGVQGIRAGREMAADLNNDNAGGFKYAIRSVNMAISSGSNSNPTPGAQTQAQAMPGGEVAGIVVGVLLALLVALFLGTLVYRRKIRGQEDFGFKVFDRITFKASFPKPRLEVPPYFSFRFGGSSASPPETVGARSQGFDNPMYGTNPLSNDKPLDMEMMPTSFPAAEEQPSYDQDLGFDNPLYENTQDSAMFRDPTAVDMKVDGDETKGAQTTPKITI